MINNPKPPTTAAAINLDVFARPGGMDFRVAQGGPIFCGSAHPDDQYVWCRRLLGHDGACAAYRHSIRIPDRWTVNG